STLKRAPAGSAPMLFGGKGCVARRPNVGAGWFLADVIQANLDIPQCLRAALSTFSLIRVAHRQTRLAAPTVDAGGPESARMRMAAFESAAEGGGEPMLKLRIEYGGGKNG